MKKRFSLRSYITIFSIVLLFSMTGKLFSEGEEIADKLFTIPQTGNRLLPLIAAVGQSQDQIRASIGIIVNQDFLDANNSTISNPGNYILSEDVDGQINITTDNVWLDLNGYTIFGPIFDPGAANPFATVAAIDIAQYVANVTIKNGYIEGTTDASANLLSIIGILANGNCNFIKIENVNIKNFQAGGIGTNLVSPIVVEAFSIRDCIIKNENDVAPGNNGIGLNVCKACSIENCIIQNYETGIRLGSSESCNTKNCIIENCNTGVSSIQTLKSTFENIQVQNALDKGFESLDCQECCFYSCKALGVNGENALGFADTNQSSNNTYKGCVAKSITGSATAIGFGIFGFDKRDINLINCIASEIYAPEADGIKLEGASEDKITFTRAKGVKIVDCIVKSIGSNEEDAIVAITARGILLSGATQCALENNNIGIIDATTNAHGIKLEVAGFTSPLDATSNSNIIKYNNIYEVFKDDPSLFGNGIFIEENCVENRIELNQITNTGTGINTQEDESNNLIVKNSSYNNPCNFNNITNKYNGRGTFDPQKPNDNIYFDLNGGMATTEPTTCT